LDFCFVCKELQQRGPSAGAADRLPHRIRFVAHPFEIAMFELDAGAGAFGRNSTSTLVTRSGSYLNSGVSCQMSTSRAGGSQTATFPISHSEPSTSSSYQRPPTVASMIGRSTSA
jgi:hypothetical protein